jgi:hypothetical protein
MIVKNNLLPSIHQTLPLHRRLSVALEMQQQLTVALSNCFVDLLTVLTDVILEKFLICLYDFNQIFTFVTGFHKSLIPNWNQI